MKKTLVAVTALLAFQAPGAHADPDFSPVIAASIGYLSSYSNTSTAFYGRTGTNIAFGGYGSQYSSTVGYCGFAAYSNPNSLIASGYSTSVKTVRLAKNDFYMMACVKSGGASGDFVSFIMNADARSAARTSTPDSSVQLENEDLLQKELVEALTRAVQAAQ